MTAEALEARAVGEALLQDVEVLLEGLTGGRRAHVEALPAAALGAGDVDPH